MSSASGAASSRSTPTSFTDAQKLPILRAYLKRWKWEVGQFFQGVGPDASDAELDRDRPGLPDLPDPDSSRRLKMSDGSGVARSGPVGEALGDRLSMGTVDVAAVLELGPHAA